MTDGTPGGCVRRAWTGGHEAPTTNKASSPVQCCDAWWFICVHGSRVYRFKHVAELLVAVDHGH